MDETNYRRVFTPVLKPDRLTRWQRNRQEVGSDKWLYYDAQLELSKLKRASRRLEKRDTNVPEIEEMKNEIKEMEMIKANLESEYKNIHKDDSLSVEEQKELLAELKSDIKTINAKIKSIREQIQELLDTHFDNIQQRYFNGRAVNDALKEEEGPGKYSYRGTVRRWLKGRKEERAVAKAEEKAEKKSKASEKTPSYSRTDSPTPTPTPTRTKETRERKNPADMSREELDAEVEKIKNRFKDESLTLDDYNAAKALIEKAEEMAASLETPKNKIALYEKFSKVKKERERFEAAKAIKEAAKVDGETKFTDYDAKEKAVFEKFKEQNEKLRTKRELEEKVAALDEELKKHDSDDKRKERAELMKKINTDIQPALDTLDNELYAALGLGNLASITDAKTREEERKRIRTQFETTLMKKYKDLLTSFGRDGFSDTDKTSPKKVMDEIATVRANLEKEIATAQKNLDDRKEKFAELDAAGEIPTEDEYRSAKNVVAIISKEMNDLQDETKGWDLHEAIRIRDTYKANHPEVEPAPDPSPAPGPEPKKPLSLEDMRSINMTEEDIQLVLRTLHREAEYTPPTPDPSR